jgi:hypothetical protein
VFDKTLMIKEQEHIMVMMNEGAVVRQSNRPEVWKIQSSARRWIPDPETLNTLGGWQSVTVLSPGQVIDNPLGPMLQSVTQPHKWDDGSLIAAWPNPRVYVMERGYRRWITSPQVMADRGYDWQQIQHISEDEMNAIAEGAPDYGPGPLPPELVIRTGRQFLGHPGHYMETNAKFTRSTGEVVGSTMTETITWFGGFHGAVYALLTDEHGIYVPGGQTPLYRYGVDGTAIGMAKRLDGWSFQLDPARAGDVRNLTVFHTAKPDDFQVVLDKWVAAGKSVGELASSVKDIAAVVAALAKPL